MQLSGQATSVTVTGALDTELAPALALTDAMANPTTPFLGAGVLVWNGTGWDRQRGDIANGLDVDVTRLPALPAGSNVIGHVIVDSAGNVAIASLPALPAGSNVIGHVIVDSAGGVVVTALPALPAGTNAIGKLVLNDGVDIGDVTINNAVGAGVYVQPGTSAQFNVVGNLDIVPATFQRPNDVLPYTAKDIVSNSIVTTTLMTFTNIARVVGGTGYITCARLVTDSPTALLGAAFRLWLYTVLAPTVVADNVSMALLYANRANRLGSIDFDATTTQGAGSDSASSLNTDIRLRFKADPADRNLYGLLQIVSGSNLIPAQQQNFYVELTTDQF